MREHYRWRFVPFAAALWIWMLAGCGHWPVRPGGEAPGTATLPELLERIDSRTSGLDSLRALIAVETGGGQPFVAGLVWARPQSLHVTGLSPFGSPLFEIKVDGGMVEWSAPGRSSVLLGSVDSLEQRDSVDPGGFPVPVEDLVAMMRVLTGPVMEDGERAALEATRRYYLLHVVRIEGDQARLTKRFYIDRASLRLIREDVFGPEGSARLRFRFKEYRATEQGEWAHRMLVNVAKKDREFGLVFRELHFNPPLPREEFQFSAAGTS